MDAPKDAGHETRPGTAAATALERSTDRPAPVGVVAGIVSHNGREKVLDTIKALVRQNRPPRRILLIDVASTDGTADLVAAHFPNIEIVRLAENRGPNPARNAVFEHSDEDWVFLVDDDAEPDPTCLERLVDALERHSNAGIVIPRVVHAEDRDTIQNDGTLIHFLSEAILVNADTPIIEADGADRLVTAATGICMLVSRQSWQEVGGFDEDYFFGREDGEFTFKMSMSGRPIFLVPEALCAHRLKKRGFRMLRYQTRNRHLFTLTLFSAKSLLVLWPALVLHELSVITFLLLKGRILPYLSGVLDLVRIAPLVMRKRRALQTMRTISDRHLLTSGRMSVRADLVESAFISFAKRAMERFYGLYWKLAAKLL